MSSQEAQTAKTSQQKTPRSFNITLREEYQTVLKQYKDLLNNKKNKFVDSN